jgi:hypothetical protein
MLLVQQSVSACRIRGPSSVRPRFGVEGVGASQRLLDRRRVRPRRLARPRSTVVRAQRYELANGRTLHQESLWRLAYSRDELAAPRHPIGVELGRCTGLALDRNHDRGRFDDENGWWLLFFMEGDSMLASNSAATPKRMKGAFPSPAKGPSHV